MPLHGDYGFGSTPMLFHPTGCQPLAAAEAKNGSLYIYRQAKLATPPQRLQIAFPATLFGLPAWDPRTQTLFVTTTQGYNGYLSGLLAFRANSALPVRARVASESRLVPRTPSRPSSTTP